LLRAVLAHWAALRSSSPEWLRQQFFLREGKLERMDPGYLLTIERRAQDVLLARLPWGCGVVALPWLAERMFVRWLD
jgi:Contractile injection system tape measure protein